MEKKVFLWMTTYISKWIKPDYFSCIGLIGYFIVGGGYVLSNFRKGLLWLSSSGFIINWHGDSLECNIHHNLKQKCI